jgi:uncharacterized protein (TIGR03083 family)
MWLASLRTDAAAFTAAVGQARALAAQVPSCPGWEVGDLIRHLGSVYRWVSSHLSADNAEAPWGPMRVGADVPDAADSALLDWFGDQLAVLGTALDGVEADRPAWNWAPQAKVAGFWHRRMAHETAVHRWDAQLALGLPEPIEAKLAADTVAEVLDTFLPAGRRWARTQAEGLVRLMATDVGQEWYIRLRGDGVALLDNDTILDEHEHPTRATAAGAASDLALALWGRITFDILSTDGDLVLLNHLRAA